MVHLRQPPRVRRPQRGPLHQRPDPGTSPLAPETHVMADVGICRQFASDWREAARRRSVEPPPAELERLSVQSDVLQTQTVTPSRPDRLAPVPPPWNDEPQRIESLMLRQQTRDEVLNFVSHGHLRSSRFENLSSNERKRLSAWLLSMFGQAVRLHADTCALPCCFDMRCMARSCAEMGVCTVASCRDSSTDQVQVTFTLMPDQAYSECSNGIPRHGSYQPASSSL